jgi:hypothetical protein
MFTKKKHLFPLLGYPSGASLPSPLNLLYLLSIPQQASHAHTHTHNISNLSPLRAPKRTKRSNSEFVFLAAGLNSIYDLLIDVEYIYELRVAYTITSLRLAYIIAALRVVYTITSLMFAYIIPALRVVYTITSLMFAYIIPTLRVVYTITSLMFAYIIPALKFAYIIKLLRYT